MADSSKTLARGISHFKIATLSRLSCSFCAKNMFVELLFAFTFSTVKLGNKELFDKEQIDIKEPFPVTNMPFTS